MDEVVNLTPKERRVLEAWASAQREAKLMEVKAKGLREQALSLPKLVQIVETAKTDVQHCGSYHLEDLARLTASTGFVQTVDNEEVAKALKKHSQLRVAVTHKGYAINKSVAQKLSPEDQKKLEKIAEEKFRMVTLATK